MNDKMRCKKCNFENDLNSKFCSNCGNNIIVKNTNGNIFGILSLCLCFGSIILERIVEMISDKFNIEFVNIFSVFTYLGIPAGIILMIIGRVKYPDNKLLKIAMWIIIACAIVLFGAYLFLLISCSLIWQSCWGTR